MKKYFYLVLLQIYITTAFIFPENYELKYNYNVDVKIAHHLSESGITKFEIFSEIHTHTSKSGTILTLKNVSHLLFVGLDYDINSVKNITPTKELDILELPFYIPQEQTPKDPKILTHKSDEQWSIQLKKAIGMLFYFDKNQLNLNQGDYVHVDENLGHISNQVLYSVNEKNENMTTFQKDAYTKSPPKFNSTGFPNYRTEDPKNLYFYRYIDVTHTLSEPFISRFESHSVYAPNKGTIFEDIDHSATIDQKINIVSTIKNHIETPVDISNFHLVDTFNFDNTKYRHVVEYDNENIDEIIETLELIVDYMENMKIDFKESVNTNRNISILKDTLELMKQSSILDLCEQLSSSKSDKQKQMMQVFLDILPHVNTKSTLLTIIYLIENNKVDNNSAVRMLKSVTYRYKNYDSEIVEKLLNLIKSTDISEQIKFTAFLAASSMLKNKPLENTLFYSTKIAQRGLLLDKISYYLNDTKKPVNVLPLSNVQSPELKSLILNKSPYENIPSHTRALGMLTALDSTVELDEKSGEFYKFIVLNKTEEFEVRAMALYVLAYRSRSDFLFDLIQSSPDDEMCNYFYNIMKTISEGKSERHRGQEKRAGETLIRLSKCTNKKLKFFEDLQYYVDTFNSLTPEGEFFVIGDPKKYGFVAFHKTFITSIEGKVTNRDSVYVHIAFPDGTLMKNPNDYFQYLKEPKKVCLGEIVTLRDDVVISADYVEMNFDGIWEAYVEKLYLQKSYTVEFPIETEKIIMTDAGFPFSLHTRKFTTQVYQLILQTEPYFARMNKWDRLEYGFKFYNPFVGAWHGFRTVNNYQYRVNASVTFTISPRPELKFEKISEDDDFDGFQITGHTEVYLDENKFYRDVLKKSCSTCVSNHHIIENIDYLTFQKKEHISSTIWKYDDYYTGKQFKMKIFDCDEKVLKNYENEIESMISTDKNQNLFGFKKMYDVWNKLQVNPRFGMCGIGARIRTTQMYASPIIRISWNETKNSTQYINRFVCSIKSDLNLTPFGYFDDYWTLNFTMDNVNETYFEAGLQLKNSFNLAVFISASRNYNDFKLEDRFKFTKGYFNDSDDLLYDSTKFEIHASGSFSDQQNKNFENEIVQYEKCSANPEYSFDDCVSSITGLKNYDVNVKFENASDSCFKWILKRLNQNTTNISGEFDLNFKIPSDKIDISTIIFERNQIVDEITIDGVNFLKPYNVFKFDDSNYMCYCEIDANHLQTPIDMNAQIFSLPNGWTSIGNFYVSNSDKTMKISIKRTQDDQDTLVLRLTKGNDTLIFDINDIVNESVINIGESLKYHNTFNMEYIFFPSIQTMMINLKQELIVIEFNGKKVKLSYPLQDQDKGLCL